MFIAISTSGRSPNVILALNAAREAGLVTVGFTGTAADGAMAGTVRPAPSAEAPLIQQIRRGAAICGLVELSLFPNPEKNVFCRSDLLTFTI